MYIAKSVMVFGSPAGNLWDIYEASGRHIARVSYHGNKLHYITGYCVKALADEAIERMYQMKLAGGLDEQKTK